MAVTELRRRDMYQLRIPVEIPLDVSRVEVDQYPTEGTSTKALVITFHKNDGTTVVKKAAIGKLTESGLTITLS